MPLVSGGVLHKLARQFGVNLPDFGGASARGGGFSGSGHGSSSSAGYYGSTGYGYEDEMRGGGYGGGYGGGGGLGGFDMQTLAGGLQTAQSLAGGVSGLASLAGMASKFM